MQHQKQAKGVGRKAFWLFFLVLSLSPAYAQREGGTGQYPGGVLNGSAGSVAAMIPTGPLPAAVPIPPELKTIGVSIPIPVLMMQSEGRVRENLLEDVISFNTAMDKLLPFCACDNVVDWRAYNEAVNTTKKLRRSLTAAVAEEKKTFSRDATQPQIEAVLKRLNAVDQITTSLEKATKLLTLLADSLKNKR